MANVRVTVKDVPKNQTVVLYQGADHTQAAALAAGIIAGGGYDALEMRCEWGGPTQQQPAAEQQQRREMPRPAERPEEEQAEETEEKPRPGPTKRPPRTPPKQ